VLCKSREMKSFKWGVKGGWCINMIESANVARDGKFENDNLAYGNGKFST
jgi:hypothetical protein